MLIRQDWDAVGLTITTGQAGATVRMAIYSDENGYPGTLIEDFGSLDASTSGTVTSSFGANLSLNAGLYWVLSIISNNAVRLPVTAHTGFGEPATMMHSAPAGSNTTVYHNGYSTPDTVPPAAAPSGMSTNRYLIMASLRAA